MSVSDKLAKAVAWRDGRVSPEVYFDDDIYQSELDNIFYTGWVPIGHEGMVAERGTYVAANIGDVPIIITRDNSNVVHALINRCRHRGNEVCLCDRGRASSFTCSYHGWTYGLDGSLVGVPRERELYGTQFDKKQWGLEPLKVENFHGLLFGSLDASMPSLDTWLGEDTRWWLENIILVKPLGGLRALPGLHRARMAGNWKLMAENFIGDNYHVPVTHASWKRAASEMRQHGSHEAMIDSPLPIRPGTKTYELTTGFNDGCPMGLGSVLFGKDGDVMYERDLEEAKRFGPSVVDWVRARHDTMQKALAAVDPKPYGFINGLLFPNLCLMGYVSAFIGRHMILLHPSGPKAHEMWQWTLVERDTPDEVLDTVLRRVYEGQAMGGVVGIDDVENFERTVEAMSGRRSQRLPFNFRAHIDDSKNALPGVPGKAGDDPTEVNQRQFYRFWMQRMGIEEPTAKRATA